ncbi:MAG: DUF167 domain-containing protein [Pyrinomonadaceae bacterium]
MIEYSNDQGSVTFAVRVIARASRTEIVGEHVGALKVRLNSPPVDGAANTELIKLLAKHFGVAKSDVEIISGHTNRSKKIRISGEDVSGFAAILKGNS